MSEHRANHRIAAYIDNQADAHAARIAVIQVLRELDGCANCLTLMLLLIGPQMAQLTRIDRTPTEVLAESMCASNPRWTGSNSRRRSELA